jgi:6-phosphogluconate dehydrogenase
MNDKGFNVVAYNRTTSKVDHFLANEAKGNIHPSLVHSPLLTLTLV